jgi:hypothetical protein
MKAIYSTGPMTGLRVYAETDTARPILHIDPCAHSALRKLAKDALAADKLQLAVGGELYEIDKPDHFARDVLAMVVGR